MVEFSRLGGLIGNYDIVAKSRTPIWLYHRTCSLLGFTGGSMVKNLPANAGDESLIPGSGISPGEGNGNPL